MKYYAKPKKPQAASKPQASRKQAAKPQAEKAASRKPQARQAIKLVGTYT